MSGSPLDGTHKWRGTLPCGGANRGGHPCKDTEIDGLGYCLHHVPDEDLAEAEALTGFRRCRHQSGQPDACRFFAISDTDPPVCKTHAHRGARQAAGKRAIEGRIVDAATRLAAEPGNDEKLACPPDVGNPLELLLEKAALANEWEKIARKVMLNLQTGNWRYQTGRAGEQTRAELLLWERSLDRIISVLVQIVRLNIAKQLVGIKADTMKMLERAITDALAASGADLEGQAKAREVLKSRLKVIDGGAA